ncbi:GNAT family N-acetyltransferase [Candidatus Woesearchaeota archaeon]|nr:GNAT family N-acetyltransferase [Candidatus Woesearchaeota archaeon]
MDIRNAQEENIKSLEAISKEFDFEPNRDWKGLVKDHEMFLLFDADRVIGFTGLIEYKWNRTLQISNIFVRPEYRGQKLAQKLLTHLIGKAEKTGHRCLIAEAPSDNSVVKLYETMGFRKCGHNDRYYSNTGEPQAFWMSYDLE